MNIKDLMTPQGLTLAVDMADKYLGDKRVLGALSSAAQHVNDAHKLVLEASGGKIDVLGDIADSLKARSPEFASAVSTHVSAATTLLTEKAPLGQIANKLKDHLEAGAQAVKEAAGSAPSHLLSGGETVTQVTRNEATANADTYTKQANGRII